MPATIITIEDLIVFKSELIEEIKSLITNQAIAVPEEIWLKSPQIKKMLNISHGTLQHLRLNGTIPYRKIGGTIFYNKKEINNIIDSNKIHHGTKS